MGFTLYEQETVVNYNAAEKLVSLYTRDKAVMRKLDELVSELPEVYKLVNETEIDKLYSFPKYLLSFRKPRVLSESQKRVLEKMWFRKRGAHEEQ